MSGSSPLTIAQINAMAEAMTRPRDRAAFLLSCGCGLRAGTLRSLTLANVLDTEHRLTGRIAIPRRSMKGKKKAHTVDIPARALNALANWIAVHPAPHRGAPLWPSEKNPDVPIGDRHWRRIFTEAARAAGLTERLSTHSARKFYAHAVYDGTGHDIQLTTRALGNKSPMATMHYLDFGGRRITSATLAIFDDQMQRELIPAAPEQNPSSST